ncbi:hypothetical protein Q5752_000462 [Cryptotrichosporon argae]
MASLPPRLPNEQPPHKLSTAGNVQQATAKVNRFAKRDPALYPLSAIVIGIFGVAGYFMMKKNTEPEPARKLMSRGVVNPWDSVDKHDTHPSQVASFKYRYKTRDGHMEDSHPTLNEDVRNLKDTAAHKYHTN